MQHGFHHGDNPEDLFRGTSDYYARYRRPYPREVVDALVARCGSDGRGRLLDAGCGTGQVFRVMAHLFDSVIAFDPDPGMVESARQLATDLRLTNVRVDRMRAEELTRDVAPLRLAVFGASFHWTDRVRVADQVYDLLEPNGHLAILAPGGIDTGTTDWELAIRDVLARYQGSHRPAGTGIYVQGERHEEVLKRSRFARIDVIEIPIQEQWTIDQIVGFLYSTSFASKAVLGERVRAFERDLRAALQSLQSEPDVPLTKHVEHTIILAAP